MEEAPVVTVEQGQLQGKVVNSPSGKAFYSFQGIPYARPPLGSLRFKDPQPAEPWQGIHDATTEGNVSHQIDYKSGTPIGDENSLFLNVYTPSIDGAFLPVMVYIHGGAFRVGSGNASSYGADFLVEKDVVVVTINYRLGALGFLCLNSPEVPGNAGLKDQALALKWVKDNVHSFGGNAGNLTVFGQSVGAFSTSVLTVSPLTKGEISRAIIQSGGAISSALWQGTPVDNAKQLAKYLGCESTDADDILNFLQATPAKEILEATEALSPMSKIFDFGEKMFWPVIEKEFPNVKSIVNETFLDLLTSGRIADVPILTGVTDVEIAFEPKVDDLSVFIPAELNIERNSAESLAAAEKIKQLYFNGEKLSVENWGKYFRLHSDVLFNYPHHRYIKHLVQVTNRPVFSYNFGYVGALNIDQKLGYLFDSGSAAHSSEIGYLFRCDLTEGVETSAQDLKVRERMVSLWTNFAKTGNPTPEENHTINVTWQPVTRDTEYYLDIGSDLALKTNLLGDRAEFWDDLYQKHFKIWEQPRNNANGISTTVLKTEVEEIEVVEREVEETKEETVVEEKENSSNSVLEGDSDVTLELTEEVVETKVVDEELKSEVEVVKSEVEVVKSQVDEVVKSEVEEMVAEVVEEVAPAVVQEEKFATEKPEERKLKEVKSQNGFQNGDAQKVKTSNEIKMGQSNGAPKDVIRANDPPEDDLPKNIGVNKFVNFFESLGGKK